MRSGGSSASGAIRARTAAGSPTHEYAYDADGNMLRGDEMGAPQFEYDFTTPGALQRRRRPDGTIEEFEFDAAGQLTATGDMQLEFDARGRLTRAGRRTARSSRWCTTTAARASRSA